MKTTHLQKQSRYEASNREAAEVILDDVDSNGGEESAVVKWARIVLSKSGGSKATSEQEEETCVLDANAHRDQSAGALNTRNGNESDAAIIQHFTESGQEI